MVYFLVFRFLKWYWEIIDIFFRESFWFSYGFYKWLEIIVIVNSSILKCAKGIYWLYMMINNFVFMIGKIDSIDVNKGYLVLKEGYKEVYRV